MSDDLNIDFSQARAEVDQTVKAIDWLTLSVEKLNRAKVTDIKTALASLEAKGVPGIEASLTNTFSNLNKLEGMLVKSGDNVKKHSEKSAKELLASITLSFEQIQAAVVTHLTGVNALHRRAAETKLAMQQATDATSARAQEKLADIQLKADRVFTAATIAEAKRRADGILAQENRARVGGRTNAFGVFISDSQTASQAASAGSLSAGSNGSASAAAARSRVGSTDALGIYQNAIPSTKDIGRVGDLSAKFKQLTLDGNDVHSMARGLASGFNLLWLTWGNLVPLFAGAAISFGAKGIVQLGSDVDHTMTTIRVLSQESTESVQGLRTQLLGLSKDGIYGPIEVANAMKTMSLAGLDAKEVSASIKDVLNFAVAGTTDLKSAADVMTSVATAFGISAHAYNYVGDVITKTAAVSKSSVESIGEAFKTASVLQKQYGISLEDVGVGLAALSNLGIQGTAAGTALRNMYVDLSGRTPKVSAALKALGLELRDQHGNFKNLVEMTKDLNAAFSNLTGKAQKDAMAVITSERGAKPLVELRDLAIKNAQEMSTGVTYELDRLAEAIANSAGFAAISAAQMAQTPLNQMKSVSNALQTSLVEAFDVVSPHVLRLSAQLKDMFNSAEFKQGLETIGLLVIRVAGALATLTQFIVEHTVGVAAAVVAYAVLTNRVQYAARAKTEEAAATVALTAAERANSAGKLAGLAGLAKWLPGIGTAVAVATGLWTVYSIATNSAKDANKGFVESGSVDQLIKELDRETARIEKNTQALRENISTKELEARKLLTSTDTDAHKNLAVAEARLAVIKTEVDLKLKTYGEDTRVGKAALASLDMAQKQVDLRKEELSTEQYTLAVSMEKLKIAAKTQTELQKSKAVPRVEGPGTFGAKGTPPPRERSLTAATIVDNMAKIKELGNAELSILQNQYEKERTLLEAMHDAKLDSEGTYRAKLLLLTTTSEDARIAKINETGVKELAEYERLKQEHTYATEFEIAHLKVSEDQRAEIVTQKRNALTEKLKSLDAQYAAVSATNAAAISKIEEDKYMRMQKAAYAYAGVVNKILEDTRIAEEKAARANRQQNRLAELSQTYGMVTTATTVFQQAEKAAAEAGLSMGFQLEEALVPLNKELDRANQSMLDFVTYSIQAGVSGTKDYEAAVEGLQGRINALEAQRDSIATTGARDMALAASRAYNKVITEDVLRLKNATSDALVTALFEGGKAGAKKLRSLLLAELRKPVTMVINAVVNTVMGSVTGALSGSAGSAGGSMLSSAGAGLGSQFMTGLSAWGEGGSAATVIQGAMGMGEGAGLYSVMEGIGAASPYILAAYAAYKILSSATKDTIPSIEGGFASTGGLLGSANGKNYENGAYGGLIDSIAKTVGTGVVDSYGSTVRALGGKAGKLDVQNFIGLDQGGDSQNAYAIDAQLNGQWLYNRWTDQGGNNYAGKTDAEMTAAQDLSAKKIVLEALKATGLGPLLDDYLQTVATNGKTLAEITAYFTDLTTLNAVKQMIEKMPLSLSYLNKEGHAAILGLVKIAGSLENLTGAVDNYYSLFATTGEKLADSTASTTTALAKLGLSMPTEGLREWYRVQVAASGAQDLSIESNAVAYYSLLKLASSVDEVAKAAEESAAVRQTWQDKLDVLLKRTTEKEISLKSDLASTTDVATQALIRQVYAQETLVESTDTLISDTKSAFDRAADAERDRINLLISDQEKVVDSLKSVFDFLTSEMKSLYAEVLGSASSASAQFYSILAVAQQTGVLPEESVLRDAVSLARSSVTGAVYGSQTEARYAKLVLAGQLRQLADIAGPQLTDAEKTLDLYKAQLTSLEEMVKKADAIVNKLTGVEDGIGNVTVLLARLVELQTTVKVATAATATTAVFGGTATGTNVNQPVGGYVYNPDDFGGLSAEEYNRKVKGILSSLGNVPQLDVGTNYVPHDMLAMLHKGEAVVPPAYNHESGLSQDSEKALQLIAAEVAQMRRDNIALAADMAKVAKAFNGQQGAPIRVEVMQ